MNIEIDLKSLKSTDSYIKIVVEETLFKTERELKLIQLFFEKNHKINNNQKQKFLSLEIRFSIIEEAMINGRNIVDDLFLREFVIQFFNDYDKLLLYLSKKFKSEFCELNSLRRDYRNLKIVISKFLHPPSCK